MKGSNHHARKMLVTVVDIAVVRVDAIAAEIIMNYRRCWFDN